MLMLSLLALPGCARNALVVDTFCQDYTPVVQQADDVKGARPAAKKRILKNELVYEDRCAR